MFTHWQQSKRAKRETRDDKVSDENEKLVVIKELRNMGFDLKKKLDLFFIYNKIHTMS